MGNHVQLTWLDGVVTVTIENPPVNALSDPVLEELADAAGAIAGVARAAVLTGAGERTFVAGADLEQFRGALGDAEAMAGHVDLTARVFDLWARLPIPVIAAVGGHAMGGGLELALVADLIVADPRARLGTPEVTLGLIPGAGGTQRLGRRVGRPRAVRMLMLGETLKADAASEVGLVDVVAEPGTALATARELAERLAELPGAAVAAIKAALAEPELRSLSDGLARERELFLAVTGSEDAREGVEAFLDKRAPTFTHR